MRVLVSGGAGYVGSFVTRVLRTHGHHPVVLDDLSVGHAEAVTGFPLVEANCGDIRKVAAVMTEHGIEAVVHLAALSVVGESVRDPGLYWRHNVGHGAGLLDACRQAGVTRFVLSSTAAVYGEPECVPIPEDHRLSPTSPYGNTKRALEEMLAHFQAAAGLGFVSLRYFNAAGAMPDGSAGEDHRPETHLIPLALGAALGQRSPLAVFGSDYPTRDGTGVRDYIHVLDLAEAHVLALDWLQAHPGRGRAFNLGSETGASVREVLDTIARITGREVPHRLEPRRAGDPAVLIASSARARAELGWRPTRSGLDTLIADAWAWHHAHPKGY